MKPEWFYFAADEIVGPVTFKRAAEFIKAASKAERSSLLLWRDGFIEWKTANSIEDFSPLLTADLIKPALEYSNENCNNCAMVILENYDDPECVFAVCKKHRRTTEPKYVCDDWTDELDDTQNCTCCIFCKETWFSGPICTNYRSLFNGKAVDRSQWCVNHKLDLYKTPREVPTQDVPEALSGDLKHPRGTASAYLVLFLLLVLSLGIWWNLLPAGLLSTTQLVNANPTRSPPATVDASTAAKADSSGSDSPAISPPPLKSFDEWRAAQPNRRSEPVYIPDESAIDKAARNYSGGDPAKEQFLREGLCAFYENCK